VVYEEEGGKKVKKEGEERGERRGESKGKMGEERGLERESNEQQEEEQEGEQEGEQEEEEQQDEEQEQEQEQDEELKISKMKVSNEGSSLSLTLTATTPCALTFPPYSVTMVTITSMISGSRCRLSPWNLFPGVVIARGFLVTHSPIPRITFPTGFLQIFLQVCTTLHHTTRSSSRKRTKKKKKEEEEEEEKLEKDEGEKKRKML